VGRGKGDAEACAAIARVAEARAAGAVGLAEALEARAEAQGDTPMVFGVVDADAVASIVGDWTGIPIGRMVKDEIASVLTIADQLKKRVVGQDHAMEAIAKRIQTSRAKLDNPNKPVGVFMLCGPSGRRQDRDRARAALELLYLRRGKSDRHQHERVPGSPYRLDAEGCARRLCRLRTRRRADRGGAPPALFGGAARRGGEGPPRRARDVLPGVRQGLYGRRRGRYIDFKNTLILLTSNVGTDLITSLSEDPEDDQAGRGFSWPRRLRPELLKVFPPALLGRLVVLPYYPLSAGHAERHRAAAARPHREAANRREPRCRLHYGEDVIDAGGLALQRGRFRRPR
jgi:type VI secretion system protein VasG